MNDSEFVSSIIIGDNGMAFSILSCAHTKKWPLPRYVVTVVLLLSIVFITKADVSRPAHHTDEGFRNLYIERNKGKNFFTFIKMRYFSDEKFADHDDDKHLMPISNNAIANMNNTSEQPHITWLGHSTFLIQYKAVTILTDPILSDRASPVFFAGPDRLVDKPITISDIPEIDYVIISHNHYDHLDQFTIENLGDKTMFLVPLKLKEWFEDIGIAEQRVHELDWWDELQFDNVRFVATPSQHWSGRGLHDRYTTLWASWRIDFEDFSFWFAGDTGYNNVQFKQIYDRYGKLIWRSFPLGPMRLAGLCRQVI